MQRTANRGVLSAENVLLVEDIGRALSLAHGLEVRDVGVIRGILVRVKVVDRADEFILDGVVVRERVRDAGSVTPSATTPTPASPTSPIPGLLNRLGAAPATSRRGERARAAFRRCLVLSRRLSRRFALQRRRHARRRARRL